MRFELTREYLTSLRQAIAEGNDAFIIEQIKDLHPAEFAEIFDELDIEEAKYLYKHVDAETAADIILELDEEVREKFLSSLSSKEIAEKFIENMDTDDAADVINELPEKVQEEVLAHLEDEEHSSDIIDLLNYDENTAGGLMAKEFIKVNVNWNALKCVREMRRQAEDIEYVYTIYVVDDDNKLLGLLSLKKLLLAPSTAIVADIYDKDVISVKANATSGEVANIMDKYDLVVLPVVDQLGRLIGRITIDDVVDVIREEAGRDYQMMSGISGKVESSDRIWILSKSRLPWLMVGFIGEIFNSKLIGSYEGQLHIHPEMAFFMPLIAAMGGSVGVQSSSIIVQGLANNSFGISGMYNKIFKELAVALLNGIILSLLILGFNLYFNISTELSFTVSLALLSVILFASIFGTSIPFIFKKMNVDPALATGPFITTVNDILAMFLYFSIGMILFGHFK